MAKQERQIIQEKDYGSSLQVFDFKLEPEQKDVISRALQALSEKQDHLEEAKKAFAQENKRQQDLCGSLMKVLIDTNARGSRKLRRECKVKLITYSTGKELEFLDVRTGEVRTAILKPGEQAPLAMVDAQPILPIYLDFDLSITLDEFEKKVE